MNVKKKVLFIFFVVIILFSLIGGGIYLSKKYQAQADARAIVKAQQDKVEELINGRRDTQAKGGEVDVFGDDNLVRVLLVGLDSRTGQPSAHCDAIQLFEINRVNKTISITAVPRGTYAPLPGVGHLATDYYVSKSCEVGGLEYGIEQIERILGKKADYVVMVGFSEALGILRYLKLPTTETLQWLRHRQGYAIGEPQRARNHSTFLKQMIVKYIPDDKDRLDNTWQYLLYKMIKTDLSFDGTKQVVNEIAQMNLGEEPWRVSLSMRPAYEVQDIAYDPEKVDEYLHRMIDPIKHLLNKDDYSDISDEDAEKRLLDLIKTNKNEKEFIEWAFDNNLWLQVESDEKRAEFHYHFISKYAESLETLEEQEELIADYILEMEYIGLLEWRDKGRRLLEELIAQ